MDLGTIATFKAYDLRNTYEEVVAPTEDAFKGIMDREQHSSGNEEHFRMLDCSHY
jgi:hypothetical protein